MKDQVGLALKKMYLWLAAVDIDSQLEMISIIDKLKTVNILIDDSFLSKNVKNRQLSNEQYVLIKLIAANMKQWVSVIKIDLTYEIMALDQKIMSIPSSAIKQKTAPAKIDVTPSKKKRKLTPEAAKKTIDFTKRSRIVKGMSQCFLCNTEHVDNRKFKMRDGKDKIICWWCSDPQHYRYQLTASPHKVKSDFMDITVAGSFGTGRKK